MPAPRIVTIDGKPALTAGKMVLIPDGSTADDCDCCGVTCPATTCLDGMGTEQVITQATFEIDLPDTIIEWRRKSGTIQWYKNTVSGWSQFNGTYVLERDANCDWILPDVTYELDWEVQEYFGQPGVGGCPTTINGGGDNDSGAVNATVAFVGSPHAPPFVWGAGISLPFTINPGGGSAPNGMTIGWTITSNRCSAQTATYTSSPTDILPLCFALQQFTADWTPTLL